MSQYDILNSVIGENDWNRNDDGWYRFNDENGELIQFPMEGYYEFDKGMPFILDYDKYERTSPKFFVPDNLQKLINWKGCVLISRSTPQFISLIDSFPKNKTKKYLSMWDGYLNSESPAYNKKLAKAIGSDYEYIHTSGHADSHTLQQLFWEIDSQMIIPIHTSNPRKFLEEFPDYKRQFRLIKDGETIDLEKEDFLERY